MPADVIPGAEAWSTAGGPVGVLVIHGFTGSPATMRPVADALAGAGLAVAVPRLPGHGTAVEDMVATRFADWAAEVDDAYLALSESCARIAVVGLSMGATLACWLAARRPVTGVVCVNPMVMPVEPALMELVRLMLDAGETVADGVGADLADPEAVEIAYAGAPLAPALSLYLAIEELQDDLRRIACPGLIMTSTDDHVVHPDNSDHLASVVAGPVERVSLDRSYHVATLDHDREEVAARTLAFVRRVSA